MPSSQISGLYDCGLWNIIWKQESKQKQHQTINSKWHHTEKKKKTAGEEVGKRLGHKKESHLNAKSSIREMTSQPSLLDVFNYS